jgi:protein O-GlcNAc transferase
MKRYLPCALATLLTLIGPLYPSRAEGERAPASNASLTKSSTEDKSGADLNREAYRHLVNAEYSEARQAAMTALAKNSQDAYAHAALGNALLGLGKDEESAQEIQQALRLNPDLPLAHVALGVKAYALWAEEMAITSLHLEGNPHFQTMVQELGRVLKKNPNDVLALNSLGVAYSAIGVFYQKQAKSSKDMEKARSMYGKAADYLQRAVQADGTFSAPLYNLGNVYFMQNRAAEAESAYRQAIVLSPTTARYHADLAAALWREQRTPEARNEARIAMNRGFTDHWVYEKLDLNR